MLINYRPLTLLALFAKMFEKIIFTSMFEDFIGNELLTVCQFDFVPGDSCTSQLLSTINEIQKSFLQSSPIDVRGVFLDISKTFDKGWYKGLAYELKSYGISGNLLKLIENIFLVFHKEQSPDRSFS